MFVWKLELSAFSGKLSSWLLLLGSRCSGGRVETRAPDLRLGQYSYSTASECWDLLNPRLAIPTLLWTHHFSSAQVSVGMCYVPERGASACQCWVEPDMKLGVYSVSEFSCQSLEDFQGSRSLGSTVILPHWTGERQPRGFFSCLLQQKVFLLWLHCAYFCAISPLLYLAPIFPVLLNYIWHTINYTF